MSDDGAKSVWTKKYLSGLDKPSVALWVLPTVWAFILLLVIYIAPIRMSELGLNREEKFFGWAVVALLLLSTAALLVLTIASAHLSNSKTALFIGITHLVVFVGGILSLQYFNYTPAQLMLALMFIVVATTLCINIALGFSLLQERRRSMGTPSSADVVSINR